MRDRLLWAIAAAALVVALLATPLVGASEVCFEDETCWDSRTMGNRISGERWLGHNGADTWGPNRINWYVHVKHFGNGVHTA